MIICPVPMSFRLEGAGELVTTMSGPLTPQRRLPKWPYAGCPSCSNCCAFHAESRVSIPSLSFLHSILYHTIPYYIVPYYTIPYYTTLHSIYHLRECTIEYTTSYHILAHLQTPLSSFSSVPSEQIETSPKEATRPSLGSRTPRLMM